MLIKMICPWLRFPQISNHNCLKKVVNVLEINSPWLRPSHQSLNCILYYSEDSLRKVIEIDKHKKPRKEIKTHITLLGLDQNMTVLTFEEALKLAIRRNLKLVKKVDFDPKTSRAVYQLMTGSQYIKEDKEWEDSKVNRSREKSIRGDKIISLSSNINEHDVLTKTKMIKKWLVKRLEVKVVITGDSNSGENVYKIIEKDIGKDGRIVQKRVKGTDIRFQILPPKQSQEENLNVTDKAKC